MPLAKSLSKIQRKLKGQEGSVHPKGRKFRQLNRATVRQQKMIKDRSQRLNAKEVNLVRVKYFQAAVNIDKADSYSIQEIKRFITVFIERDLEQLDTLKSDRRPGRPASSKQDQLQQKYDSDSKEFKTGFYVPNLTNAITVANLRAWNGSLGGLNVVQFIRVSKDSVEIEDMEVEDQEA